MIAACCARPSATCSDPLVKFGSDVYQPNEPINCVYDTWGVPAALIRGLFEYLYQADGLTILPHIPPGITELQQRFPIRFGQKRLYLATVGSGPITAVTINGQPWKAFDAKSITLPYDQTPDRAVIQICLGGAAPGRSSPRRPTTPLPPPPPSDLAMEAQAISRDRHQQPAAADRRRQRGRRTASAAKWPTRGSTAGR